MVQPVYYAFHKKIWGLISQLITIAKKNLMPFWYYFGLNSRISITTIDFLLYINFVWFARACMDLIKKTFRAFPTFVLCLYQLSPLTPGPAYSQIIYWKPWSRRNCQRVSVSVSIYWTRSAFSRSGFFVSRQDWVADLIKQLAGRLINAAKALPAQFAPWWSSAQIRSERSIENGNEKEETIIKPEAERRLETNVSTFWLSTKGHSRGDCKSPERDAEEIP